MSDFQKPKGIVPYCANLSHGIVCLISDVQQMMDFIGRVQSRLCRIDEQWVSPSSPDLKAKKLSIQLMKIAKELKQTINQSEHSYDYCA